MSFASSAKKNSDSGVASFSLAVEAEVHIGGVAEQQFGVILGRRGAERRHRLGDPELEQRDHVHVALDHDQPRDLAVRLPHLVQREQLATLVEQRRFRGVQIFRAVGLAHHAATEGDDAAAPVLDREHQPIAELVVDTAALAGREHAGHVQRLEAAVAGPDGVLHAIPSVRRVAEAEALDHRGIEAALLQVLAAFLAAGQLLLEPARRGIEHLVQFGELVLRAARHATFERHGHADPGGEIFDRIDEFEAVVVHQELDRRTMRAAAEAVIELLGWADRKRGRAFVVERATRRVVATGALQRHARLDHLDDVDAREQVIDEAVGDARHCGQLNDVAGGEEF